MGGRQSIITLTTDFGTRDPFAGIMKGVIASIHPQAVVIDLTHGIAPQNIREGAFILFISTPYFPKGSVHVAVVDPGVGGSRRPIAVKTADSILVGPDNGILSWAAGDLDAALISEIERPEYTRSTISATFHGRDVFAPAAAHLSRGVPVEELGPPVVDPVVIPFPRTEQTSGEVRGEVLYIDGFGNLMTNIRLPNQRIVREIIVRDRKVTRISQNYGEGGGAEVIALVGSTDYLEIAVNKMSAQKELSVSVGDEVTVLL